MKKETLDGKIENLKKQLEETKIFFHEISGAIKALELLKKENDEKAD